MENLRHLNRIFFIGAGILLVFPLFVYGYADTTTHPALTSEAVNLFNAAYPRQALIDEEKPRSMRGSTE